MADPFGPVITQQQVDQANRDKIEAVAKAVGIVGGLTYLNYRLNAPGGKMVQKPLQIGITGVDVKPTEAGRATVTIPLMSKVFAFAPTPLGYVPAEFYGLAPDTYKQNLPRQIGSKPPFFVATDARKEVFAAKQLADQIGRRAQGHPPDLSHHIIKVPGIPAGTIPVSIGEVQWLASLPPGVSSAQDLVPELLRRQGDLVGANGSRKPLLASDVFSGAPPGLPLYVVSRVQRGGALIEALAEAGFDGSTQPELFEPTNQAGINNQAAATGLLKLLVTERADP